MESIRSTRGTLESITPGIAGGNQTVTTPDLRKYNLDAPNLFDGVSLKHSFTQDSVEAKGHPLSLGLRDRDVTEGTFSIFGRTKLNFSEQNESVTNLRQDLLSSLTTRTMGMEQGFGSGITAGVFNFSRTTSSKSGLNMTPLDVTTQAMGLKAGFGRGLSMTSSFTTKQASDAREMSGQEWKTDFAMPFSGGAGAFSFGQSDYTGQGMTQVGSQMHLLAPIALMGQKLTIERGYNTVTTNGVDARDDLQKIALPFHLSGGAAKFEYANQSLVKPGLKQLLRSMAFEAPFKIAGQAFAVKRNITSDIKNGAEVSDAIDELQLPWKFAGGAGGYSYYVKEHKQAGADQLVRKEDFSAPLMLMGQKVDIIRHVDSTTDKGIVVANNLDKLAIPFRLIGGTGNITWSAIETKKKDVQVYQDRMDFQAPLALLRYKIGLERHVVSTTTNGARVDEDVDKYTLPLRFSGGDGLLAFTETQTRKTGLDQIARQLDFTMPFALRSSKYTFERHDVDMVRNGVAIGDLTTKIAGPLPFLSKSMLADYTVVDHSQGTTDSQTITSHVNTPVKVLGRAIATDFTNITLESGKTHAQQDITKVNAPLVGQTLAVDHRVLSNFDGKQDTEQTITQVQTPKFGLLGQRATVGANVQRTENRGGYTQQITSIEVGSKPLKPLELTGTFVTRDMGPQDVVQQRTLAGAVSLAQGLMLNAKYRENEAANRPPEVRRYMSMASSEKGLGPLGIKWTAGVVSWAAPGKPSDSARTMEAKLLASKRVQLSAQYTEFAYDAQNDKYNVLAHPNVGVAFNAGDPSHLALGFRYNDVAGRPAQERAFELKMPGLGGALALARTDNPLDPRDAQQKTIRLATVYDASLKRQLFGNVDLQLGYRYCDYEKMQDDHFASISLAGGKEDGGGKIGFTFNSGDFVPLKDGNLSVTPESSLDLSYSRTWNNDGKLGITLRRISAPIGQHGDPSMEGRMEYKTNW